MAEVKISLKGESEERSKDAFNFTNFIIESFARQENIHERNFHKLNPELHPLTKAAVRKYRILSKEYTKFHSDVYECLKALNFGVDVSCKRYSNWNHPKWRMKSILIWHPDKSKGAICFPSLKINPYDSLSGRTQWKDEDAYFPQASAGLLNEITEALLSPVKQQAWLPLRRGIKSLGVRHKLPLTRLLARYLLIDEKPPSALLVDNLAAKMYGLYAPMTYVVANTPDEVRMAYKKEANSPASCMDSTHSFGLRDSNPVDFYGYCPTTKVAYVHRSGEVLARTVLYKKPQDEEWYYSRVYANRDVYKKELVDKMKEQGIKYSSDGSHFQYYTDNVIFYVPEDIQGGSATVMPFPYFDLMPSCRIWVKHLPQEHKFKVVLVGNSNRNEWTQAGFVLPSHQSTLGYVLTNGQQNSEPEECLECGYEYGGEEPFAWIGDQHYCSAHCISNAGHHQYIQSANAEWRTSLRDLRTDVSIECHRQPALLSNLHAGMVNRAVGFYFPLIWADTEYPLAMSSRLLDIDITGIELQSINDINFTHEKTLFKKHIFLNHSEFNIHTEFVNNALFRQYDNDVESYKDLHDVIQMTATRLNNEYISYFVKYNWDDDCLEFIRPTFKIHELSRVSRDSIPDTIKNWSLCVIEGNTDFDDNMFNAMFDYDYESEVIGKLLQGVNIINKL